MVTIFHVHASVAWWCFTEFSFFMKNNILCNVRTKRVRETCFLLKVHTNSILASASFILLDFSCYYQEMFCSNVRTGFLYSVTFRQKEKKHNKKIICLLCASCKAAGFK